MQVFCPHCHNPVALEGWKAGEEVSCPSCGSSFKMGGEATTTGWDAPVGGMLGRFEVLGRLGQGAFGTVYKARDPELDRVVALKVPRAGRLASGPDLDRFLREARSAARLHHPGIVPVHEVGQNDGVPYLVTEYVEGYTLADLLTDRRPPARKAASLIAAVADALQYAHDNGVVHRDVKPENILLATRSDSGHVPRLMDFGLAKRDAGEITMTVEGQVLGTPAYMSPEQARGEAHGVDGRTDVYSLGAVLYQLLTGELPFRGNQRMLLHHVLHDDPRLPRSLNDAIPRDLETVCLKAMAKSPGRRYQTAGEMAADLRRWLAGEPIKARPVGAVERAWTWVKRRPAEAALGATGVVAAMALVGVLVGLLYNGQLQEALGKQREAREAEEEQRKRAEAALDRAEHYLYVNRVHLAERSWSANNVKFARQLLEECAPDRRGWEWHYLNRLTNSELVTCIGHTQDVAAVAYSPDGRLLASGSYDRTIRLWDAATGRELAKLEGVGGMAYAVEFSPDGRYLAGTGGAPRDLGDVRVWELRIEAGPPLAVSAIPRHHFPKQTAAWATVAFSPRGDRLAASVGHTLLAEGSGLTVFDLVGDRPPVVVRNLKRSVCGIDYLPDGKRIVGIPGIEYAETNARKLDLIVWDADSGKEVRRIPGHRSGGLGLGLSADGRQFGTSGEDRQLRFWDAASLEELRTFRGPTARVMSVAWGPGEWFLTGTEDGLIKAWDPASGEERLTLRGHAADVLGLAYHPSGKRVASAGADRTVKVWDLATEQEARTLRGHDGVVNHVAFSPDGRTLVSAGADGQLLAWDPVRGGKPRVLGKYDQPACYAAYSADGRWLAAGCGDWRAADKKGTVRLYDLKAGGPPRELKAHAGIAWETAFSPDSTRLASVGGEWHTPGDVVVWDVASGKTVWTFPQPTGMFRLAFDPTGERLAASSPEANAVKILDVATGKELRSLELGEFVSEALAWAPRGRWLAVAYSGQTIKVWDTRTWEPRLTLAGHASNIMNMTFSPDGTRLASTSFDQTVKLWDVATGAEVLTLRGHTAQVEAVAFSPDGNLLATCGNDGTVKVWDASPRAR